MINHIQLKAARYVIGIGVRELGDTFNVSKATINNAEVGKYQKFLKQHNFALIEYFAKYGIRFPDPCSIELSSITNQIPPSLNINEVLTRFQLRAARNILSLTQENLSKNLGVGFGVINHAENSKNEAYINCTDKSSIPKIKKFFESYGFSFPKPSIIFFKKYLDSQSNK